MQITLSNPVNQRPTHPLRIELGFYPGHDSRSLDHDVVHVEQNQLKVLKGWLKLDLVLFQDQTQDESRMLKGTG